MILIDGFMLVFSLITNSYNTIDYENAGPMNRVAFFIANTSEDSLKDLIIELISLSGVILMWKRKKIGFLVYLLAESFLYIEFTYVLFRFNPDSIGALALTFEMIWPLPFDLAFVIMYATQLKQMTWKIKPVAVDI